MQVLFHKHVWLYTEYMPTLHWWIGASSVSPYVMTVTWWTASGIIIHHSSGAYEFSIYWFTLIYFPAATVTITTKYQKHYFCCLYFCCCYYHYHITVLLNTLLQILSYPAVVELTTQLLILENILWLPLCRINKYSQVLAAELSIQPHLETSYL